MAKSFNTTALDFDEIKDNLKDYYKTHPNNTYSDWDFEGSGLNLLLDVLAYNTHYNAVLAHTSINESFIDSAQLRQNVVSRAKILGYTPGSRTAAKATVTLVFQEADGVGGYFELPIGAKLKTVIDGVTYNFITRNSYSALLADGVFTLSGVEIFQGKVKTSQFLVDASENEQKLILQDNTIDISTLKVKVFDSKVSTSHRVFELWSTFTGITGDSLIYFLSENYDGNYEVRFGDNVFGKKPDASNVVLFEYISTEGEPANGATVFEWSDADPTPIITIESGSANGSDQEGIESVRFNAPATFSSQNRAVTATDFRTLINSEFKDIDNMAIWGGQDHSPPQYGKCFISIKPPGAQFLSTQQKEDILALLENKRVITVIPEILDPVYTYLYFEILFKYDSTKTILTSGELTSTVRNAILDYNDNILTKFDGVFRYSEFGNVIDESDVSILNSTTRVKAYKIVDLIYGDLTPQAIEYDFKILGEFDQEDSVIHSDSWQYQGNVLSLADEAIPGNVEYRNIYAFRKDANGDNIKMFFNVGKLYLETGLIELNPVPVNQDEVINIYLEPRSNDVAAKRNNLLSIDSNKIKFTPEIDTIAVSGSAGAINYNTFDKS